MNFKILTRQDKSALKNAIVQYSKALRIANGEGDACDMPGLGGSDCELCKLYLCRFSPQLCQNCPIAEYTGKSGCRGTPWVGTKVDDMPLPVLTSIFRYKIISPFKLSEFIERLKAEIDLFKLLLKKGTKSMTTAATTKTKGITRMTLKKHNFEGYSIRKSKNSVSFQRYVSITTAEGKTKAERVRNAFVDATWKQQELLRTITDRTNLTALGKLKPLAIRALIRQGWTVKVLK